MGMSLNSLNGWQRLGIFISSIIAIPSFLVGYSDNNSAYVSYEVPENLQKLTGQKFFDSVYWDAHSKEDELKGCILSTTSITPEGYIAQESESNSTVDLNSKEEGGLWTRATITCDKTKERAIVDSFWYAAVPFMVVFGFGYVFAWISAGFRNSKKKNNLQDHQISE